VRVRLVSVGAVILLALVLVGLSVLAASHPTLAVVISLLTLTLSQSLMSVLGSYFAGLTLTSEQLVHVGAIVVTAGPAGPFTGIVTARLPRVTVLVSQVGETLIQPNAALTAGAVVVLSAWPTPIANT
jgi:hypothetical protein